MTDEIGPTATMMISARINARLAALSLSSFEVSRQLGRHQNFLDDLHTGRKKSFSVEMVPKLAAILECEPGYLLGTQDDVARGDLPVTNLNRIRRGDVVRLKSSDRLMTVKKARPIKDRMTGEEIMWVCCVWLDAVGHLHTDEFEDWLLTKEAWPC